MKNYLCDKNDSFNFEKQFCNEKPEVWKNEAINLFSSAQIILEFSSIKEIAIFKSDNILKELFSKEIVDYSFWPYRIIRMLWGYAFENLLKGIIIKKYNEQNPDNKNVPFEKIKSHKLSTLFQNAGLSLTEEEVFYINIIEKCSVWMGRYPIPIKANQMYESRKPLKTRDALIERAQEINEKYFQGEIPRALTESDILHTNISETEINIIEMLKNNIMDLY